MVRLRVRIRFCKRDDLRWIGHRDLMRSFERTFRRAEFPLGMSEGFHPKPRVTFPLPLSVGMIGDDEVMEFELAEKMSVEEIERRLTPQLPPGLIVRSVEIPPPGAGKAQTVSAEYVAQMPNDRTDELRRRIETLLAATSCVVARTHGRSELDVRPFIEELTLDEGSLRIRLRIDPRGSAGPRDVFNALGIEDLESSGVVVSRTRVALAQG